MKVSRVSAASFTFHNAEKKPAILQQVLVARSDIIKERHKCFEFVFVEGECSVLSSPVGGAITAFKMP